MQTTMSRPNARANMRGRGQRPSFKGIGRAIRYLTHYKSQAILPYLFLVIATLSQLAVPHMVGNIIDAVGKGFGYLQLQQNYDKIPSVALPGIIKNLGLPAG